MWRHPGQPPKARRFHSTRAHSAPAPPLPALPATLLEDAVGTVSPSRPLICFKSTESAVYPSLAVGAAHQVPAAPSSANRPSSSPDWVSRSSDPAGLSLFLKHILGSASETKHLVSSTSAEPPVPVPSCLADSLDGLPPPRSFAHQDDDSRTYIVNPIHTYNISTQAFGKHLKLSIV